MLSHLPHLTITKNGFVCKNLTPNQQSSEKSVLQMYVQWRGMSSVEICYADKTTQTVSDNVSNIKNSYYSQQTSNHARNAMNGESV
jgi:hypothetical protein